MLLLFSKIGDKANKKKINLKNGKKVTENHDYTSLQKMKYYNNITIEFTKEI